MRKTFFAVLTGAMFLSLSCSSNNERVGEGATTSEEHGLSGQDSVMQEVEELSVRALGNSLQEFSYDEDTLEVQAGSLVKLNITNEAEDMSVLHNVVFTKPGKYRQVALAGSEAGASGNYIPHDSAAVLAASPIVLPGQTVEMEFIAPTERGTYDFVCTYPDHWRRMHGKLIVK